MLGMIDINKTSAYEFINDLEDKLLEDAKIVDSDFNKILDLIIKDGQVIKDTDYKLYRARVYDKEDVYDKFNGCVHVEDQFKGFDKEESFVNLTKVQSQGRANVKGMPCLYASEDKKTCTLEVCPKKGVAVSIASIVLKEKLTLLDFSRTVNVTAGTFDNIQETEWKNDFKFYISHEMNLPIFDESKYVLTQYVTKYAKNKGMDGIIYDSTSYLADRDYCKSGKNVAIFNYEKCEAVSSKLYLVNSIDIDMTEFNDQREGQCKY